MPVVTLLITLIVIGVVIWAITTYIPMDAAIRNIIRVVGIIVALVIVLNAFGILGGMSNVMVPRVK